MTDQPDRLGAIRAIVADAVTAEYRSLLPTRAATQRRRSALAARELKGLLAPIAGIKKLTEPARRDTWVADPSRTSAYVARAAERVRHRNRAVQAWDYEAIVSAEFPEVATVRCLPAHRQRRRRRCPASVGLVVVPWSDEPQPSRASSLAERILAALTRPHAGPRRPVVLCPLYQGVSVPSADRPPSRVQRGRVEADTRVRRSTTYLHPGADAPFGRELFASTLVRFLESRPEVDHVDDIRPARGSVPEERNRRPMRVPSASRSIRAAGSWRPPGGIS